MLKLSLSFNQVFLLFAESKILVLIGDVNIYRITGEEVYIPNKHLDHIEPLNQICRHAPSHSIAALYSSD